MDRGISEDLSRFMGSPIGNINGESVALDIFNHFKQTGEWGLDLESIKKPEKVPGLYEVDPKDEGIEKIISSGFAELKNGKLEATQPMKDYLKDKGLI